MKRHLIFLIIIFLQLAAIEVPCALARDVNRADAASLEDAAAQFSPIFIADRYRDTKAKDRCRYNIPTLVSFDGNWDPHDNEKSYYEMLRDYPDLVDHPDHYLQHGILNVYYESIASESHLFLTYYLFYPHDAGGGCQFEREGDPGGHLNDASSLMLIVRNSTTRRKLEWIAVQDHGTAYYVRAGESATIGDHPLVKVENGTHQMSPIISADSLPKLEDNYFFGLEYDYRLAPIFPTLWAQRENRFLFCTFFQRVGLRICQERRKAKGRGTAPWAPWAREFRIGGFDPSNIYENKGMAESFFDPVKAFEELYWDSHQPFSYRYLYNPYLQE